MLVTRPTSSQVDEAIFWSLFERSRVPMALVDRDRHYVAVNDAGLELFSYSREDVIGQPVGRTVVGDERSAEGDWGRLQRTNELYGERTVLHPNGSLMRIGYAAYGSTVNGRWLAVFVALSAHFEPDGAELIRSTAPARPQLPVNRPAAVLTPREREVVRRVALGASTRQIAADLFLSPATVRSHVRNAMVKTSSHTRAQLVALVLGDVLNSN